MATLLYCDTSALVKLYVSEAHSVEVHRLSADADAVVVSRIAWVEACAAFARRSREVPGDADAMAAARHALAADWPHFVVMDISQAVVERAGDYVDAFALRAYDGVQLAAASEAVERTGDDVVFACFDHRLNTAARLLRMTVPFDQGR